ncbi:isocitrate/isopropylmalate dehydrogenase family protein [Micromonospora sp. DT201]|uniref:isocitrate/isopropylmalate dehydrogenase family protein n=1 Tax=Micromonospora sp. DT201 TaxID=3393442 RepID=UPI003CF9F2A0
MTVITVIPGDGIGPEVTEQAVAVLDGMRLGLDFDVLSHVNADHFLATGVALSDRDFRRVAESRSTLLGAVGDPRVTSSEYARGVLLRLRFELDLYVNHRPARLFDSRLSPLRDAKARNIDCVIVRENTEGLYVGIGGALRPGDAQAIAVDTEVNTHYGISRVIDYAFSIARRGVCLVDKSNAVRYGGGLWQRCWKEARERHPEVSVRHLYVDVAAMKLVSEPASFDVIVTNNSYGDILSDLAAEIAGGIGTAASANINPATGYGLYEPVHGSAPDIAGTGAANPIAAILSAALMLARINLPEAAGALEAAVHSTVVNGECTPDLGGTLTTKEVGAAVLDAVR